MALNKVFLNFLCFILIDALPLDSVNESKIGENIESDFILNSNAESDNSTDIFDGVYSECLVQLSYTCLQRKTLMYIEELNKLKEVTIIGDYVKFVKLNTSENIHDNDKDEPNNTDEFSYMIDRAVDNFFENHLIRFSALGKDILVPHKVEEFVGRKKRKGGGGHGGDDGGKKKLMMMAMMCMKMKFMMMVPAMMGMMGMMSFKGMIFSMMSFMISKMMLLMKILEKKGGSGWGGGDGGWASGGGGGGAWMPAGGQDYGGGGYDANGQWQSRSIIEKAQENDMKYINQPVIAYVKPIISYNNKIKDAVPTAYFRKEDVMNTNQMKTKSRRKRGILDTLQNAYLYWANKVLGIGYRKPVHPKYKYINGVRYVYHPIRQTTKMKAPKELSSSVSVINENELKPVVITDFNKGEIIEERSEGRMNRKKFHKMKDNVNETVDDNPWE